MPLSLPAFSFSSFSAGDLPTPLFSFAEGLPSQKLGRAHYLFQACPHVLKSQGHRKEDETIFQCHIFNRLQTQRSNTRSHTLIFQKWCGHLVILPLLLANMHLDTVLCTFPPLISPKHRDALMFFGGLPFRACGSTKHLKTQHLAYFLPVTHTHTHVMSSLI